MARDFVALQGNKSQEYLPYFKIFLTQQDGKRPVPPAFNACEYRFLGQRPRVRSCRERQKEVSRYFPQRAQTQGLGGFLPLRSKGGSVPFAAGKDREKSRPFGQKKQKASPPKPKRQAGRGGFLLCSSYSELKSNTQNS